jgi:histidinol-phosphatase (PHP family)
LSIVADSHTHSTFSGDGQDDIPEMCRAAITKGLTHICFTDHIDLNPTDDSYGVFDYDSYTTAIDRAKAEFGGRIQVLKGIEFSEPHVFRKEYESLLRQDFDVIMVGIHYVRMAVGLHWLADDAVFGEPDRAASLYRRYYEELLQVVQIGGFDVLAHFDNPKRYLPVCGQEDELIAEIMQELVSRDIVLEVNTSPFRKGCHECAPDSRILKRYIAAGGTRITLGSDAHSSQEIAADFHYARQIASANHLRVGIFQHRQFITA